MLKPKPGEVRKPTRTISGITPVAIMLPPRKCKHGSCIYCPNLNVPQSYTPKSPVVLRAKALDYDSFKQVKSRINAFKAMNHPTDKIEIIVMGGTFLEYPKKFQYEFIKGVYDALNPRKSPTLKAAKKLNEKSKYRCIALCIETRPDVCCKFIDRMREFGCTRVELGVQIIDDKIYKLVKRGHKVEDVAKATKCLKDAGFKVGYHIMPGLPGSNSKKDFRLFKKIFSDERFKPDQLKLYPCQVMPGSELEKMYWDKKYKPYTKKQIERILIAMLKEVPRYCRVMRVMREIPPEFIVAGTKNIDLRKPIEEGLRAKKYKLKEIRYREIGFALRHLAYPKNLNSRARDKKKEEINLDLELKKTKYKAAGQDEYFLEIVNKQDILFGLLRLRILQGKTAIIRELHVYGKSLKLGQKGLSAMSTNSEGRLGEGNRVGVLASQHKGLGKQLMKEAEKIAKEKKCKEIKIISGVGVREYYKKLGYVLDKGKGEYMIKDLN
jgi:elongator complex protein 3 (tRNA carboxymethyluridine synthase)